MTEEGSPREKSDLLAYALFDADTRVGNARQNLLAFLISVILFECDRPATREEVLAICKEKYLPNDGVVLNQIEVVVAASRKAGLLISDENGKITLAAERRQQLGEAAERIQSLRRCFHREIAVAVEAETGDELSRHFRRQLRAVLEGFIQRLFQEESVALAKAFGKDGNGLDDSITDQIRPESIEKLVHSITTPGEKLTQTQVAEGVRAGLLGMRSEGQHYLAAIYQKTVAFNLLQQDPSIRRVKRELAERRVYYLDTNVLIPLLFSAHPKHEQVRTVIESARKVGCQLAVSAITVEEFEAQLEKSDRRYRELKTYEEQFEIFDDDILRTYTGELKKNPNYSWDSFLAGYRPAVDALAEVGIDLVEDDDAAARFDERLESAKEYVSQAKPPYVSPRVVAADAQNLILVQLRRRKIKGDEMGRRVWMITLDHTLKVAEQRLIANGFYDIPSSKHLSAWAGGLTPHLSPDGEDLGEYVLRVVQSHLQLLAEDPVFADIDFLVTLDQSEINIDELMGAHPKKTRRVLIALQEKREIREILQEEPDEPQEREAWAIRLTEIVQEALRKLDESTQRKAALSEVAAERDEARELLEALRRDGTASRQRIAELEGKSESGTGDGIRQRLRRWRLWRPLS